MKKKQMEFFGRFGDFCKALRGSGLFLVVKEPGGKPSVMTIGWATIGIVWNHPVMTVMVRESRYTYGLMEKARYFTVNVPIDSLKSELAYCGSHSGRDVNKIRGCRLNLAPASVKGAFVLGGCDMFYECETLHKNNVIKDHLDSRIVQRYYPVGDFHRIYFGRIISSYEKAK